MGGRIRGIGREWGGMRRTQKNRMGGRKGWEKEKKRNGL